MAQNQSTSTTDIITFIKGMVKDVDDSFFPKGSWYHARNLVNNSKDGNEGTVSNEPSNTFCAQAPFTIIGAIHLNADRWAIFSTDNTLHEIGIFHDGLCKYEPLKNSLGQDMNQNNCLNFNLNNIIIGVSKEGFDCTYNVYFADKRNPDRYLTIEKPAFVEICNNVNNCLICTPTTDIDCEAIRLAPLITTPCLSVTRGPNGGSILNGSYYAVIAYVMNSQRVTDYFMPSNTQSIFEHDNVSGSLLITIDRMDTDHFDYFELVIVRFANSQTSAKKIGIYSTRQAQISLDAINEALPSVPVEEIPLRTPNYEKSDGIFEIGNYMLRVGPRARFDFNYQPLANRITARWQAVAYAADYYAKGGNQTSYLRDEVYPYFIRWVYDTGDKTSSYHIPGRPARAVPSIPLPSENSNFGGNPNALDPTDKYFEVVNTGTGNYAQNVVGVKRPDGGFLIAEGDMGYWESTEIYPDKKPDIFNASAHTWSALTALPYSGTTFSQYDLCGNPIRHHKFPDNKTVPHFRRNPSSIANVQLIVLGVEFDNIVPPVDNNGVLVPGIVGYEILRGSREGNKTIIAKGILNNMRRYSLDTDPVGIYSGLYQNYPYNSLLPDPSLITKENEGENPVFKDWGKQGNQYNLIATNQFTFHSPDTNFNNPFLSSKELKIYGETYGQVVGNFDESPEHPKEKLITDVAFIVAGLIGVGAAVTALSGKTVVRYSAPVIDKNATHGIETLAAGTGGAIWGINDLVGSAALAALQGVTGAAFTAATATYTAAVDGAGATLASLIASGEDAPLIAYRAVLAGIALTPNITPPQLITDIERSDSQNIPFVLRALANVPVFINYFTLGTNTAMDLILAIVPYTQYAMRYTSHGLMDLYDKPNPNIKYRHSIINALYLNDGFQDFGPNSAEKINNVNRSKTVALETATTVANTTNLDNTTQTIGSSRTLRQASPQYKGGNAKGYTSHNAVLPFTTQAVSHYTALISRMRNQYGQLDAIIQIPVSTCSADTTTLTAPYNSGPLFNGDTYIGRYTEKNTFFYFWDWLYDQPDGYEFNYRTRYMLSYPRFWADFTRFDAGEFLSNFLAGVTSLNLNAVKKALPSSRHSLDGRLVPVGLSTIFNAIWRVTERYFYLFQSGVRDFYVESEINTDLRDWEEPIEKRHYDPYRFTNLRALFEPKIIKAANFFKYDQSLSVSRMFNNFFSWGNVQDRDYDPFTAETCYVYYRKRVIYSLPQNLEAKKDFWRVFLANNYKDFKSAVTAVSPINKNGAMFFFYEQAPVMYQGVDTLQTDLGTKITIGDGGLFSQPEQAVVNADESYEYASCQNRLSVANTPVGLYWIGQNQGKIFRYGGKGVEELSAINMKFWFNRFLPYQLTQDFPDFDVIDNPVAGIGCQTIFNNRDTVLYFTKKDYKLRSQYVGQIIYIPLTAPTPGFFLGSLSIKLGDPVYFEDASWTMSFDPKTSTWQSFHDWHPDLMFPSKSFHLTTKLNGIWKHTDSQLSFCNFYGINYPFELDYVGQTGQTVETLRSIEYTMEAHIYKNDKTDFYHVLDWNFDHSVIYNSEQVSGMLILNDTPKNNLAAGLLYPIINPTSIDILFDKVEQKYRFNQFWDITADRGEYTFPNVQRQIWQTEANGYIRTLNPANLNYNKLEFQRKKFRHYANHVLLYKNISANVKILMKIANDKQLVSFR